MASSAAMAPTTTGDIDTLREYIIRISQHQFKGLDNVAELLETISQEGDPAGNQVLWGELMNNYPHALGSLCEDPQVLAVVDQTKPTDLKHAAEMLMWVIEKAGDQEYEDNLLKSMLQPSMKPPTDDPKPYDNSMRMGMLIQIL